MTSRVSPKECTLRTALDGHELCPGAACAFWDDGDGCAIDRLRIPVDRHRDLARHLLELRLAVGAARDTAERADAHRRFAELLNLNRE